MSSTLYRATATWPAPAPVVRLHHNDRSHILAKARGWAQSGAYVVIERTRHNEFRWRPWRTLDGPALAAAADSARRATLDDQLERTTAAFVDQVLAEHERQDHDDHERIMRRPPVPRAAAGRITARHITGPRP